ncbi:protein phosphatase Slingshot homolog 3 isoform 4-T4 [Vipera latastei]
MALVTVCRSPSGSGHSTPTGCKDEDVPRRRQLQRRHSFVMVKGAALLLPEEDKLEAVQEGPATPLDQTPKSEDAIPGQQELHLQQMVGLLRPEDTIQLAVRLESARAHRIRYLLVVSATERESKNEMVLLGVDFPDESLATCTLGMVLPLWSDTQVFLDGDGGFSVTSGGQTRIFKPISVQTMWSALQVLHKACSEAVSNNYFPGGGALNWTEWYQKAVNSDQSCINEWLAMSDLESVRPTSPSIFSDQPTAQDVTERMIRAKLREVMGTTDLESITSKEIRTELEQRFGCSLKNYKEFIDNEMLLIMAQMDWPSKIFDYLYLGSEWNAANLEELQKNRVSHILNVTREIDNFFPEHFTYMNVRIYDEEASQLLPYWKETHSFISDVRRHSSLWEQKVGDTPSEGSSDISDASSDHSGSLEYETLSSDEEPEVPVTTPQYYFRPLHEPSQNPSQPLPPTVSPQLIPQAIEETGASDDSGAEEVRRHLASMKVPEKPAILRRERINLYAIMRSISEMDSPEHTSVTEGTPEEEVWNREKQVFLHAERKICDPSSQSKENEKPVTAKLSLPGDQRAHGQRPGRRGRSRGSKVHAQPCKQLSYHPAPGKVHKAVRHMEGSGSCGRRPPLQHRLSVAQLADAALVVSRTKEFEGQMNPEISKKLQLPSSLPCSRSRQVVRQASVDMDPSSV